MSGELVDPPDPAQAAGWLRDLLAQLDGAADGVLDQVLAERDVRGLRVVGPLSEEDGETAGVRTSLRGHVGYVAYSSIQRRWRWWVVPLALQEHPSLRAAEGYAPSRRAADHGLCMQLRELGWHPVEVPELDEEESLPAPRSAIEQALAYGAEHAGSRVWLVAATEPMLLGLREQLEQQGILPVVSGVTNYVVLTGESSGFDLTLRRLEQSTIAADGFDLAIVCGERSGMLPQLADLRRRGRAEGSEVRWLPTGEGEARPIPERLMCGNCRATGRLDFFPSGRCPMCQGEGWVWVTPLGSEPEPEPELAPSELRRLHRMRGGTITLETRGEDGEPRSITLQGTGELEFVPSSPREGG